jgi:hypothetical protein
VETVVQTDYTCRRVLRLDAYANPRFPNQRIRLGDYFQFPPAEMYDTYLAQPEKAAFAGAFNSFEMIPADLVRFTPGSSRLGGNAFSFRAIDLVVAVLADFDETIHDTVVSREDGEAALDELVRLLTPEIMAVLNARYGQRYDLARLEHWLLNDLSAKLRRVYSGVWNIHNYRRSGVTSPGEDYEIFMFFKAEAEREGLRLEDPFSPDAERENLRRSKEYAMQLVERLCPPRQSGGPPLSRDMLTSTIGDELIGALQKTVSARHGSINEFLRKIGAQIPRAFGSYLTPKAMPIYMLPEVAYFYRLKIPGQVLQTNAVRDVNGDLVWTFTDRDIAFSGQSMWARTLFVREPVVLSLGLRGFPENLAEVDRLFGLCVDAQGRPRETLLTAMQQSAAARGMRPLENLADNAASPDAHSARGVLELFAKYRRGNDGAAMRPEPGQPGQPPPTAPQANHSSAMPDDGPPDPPITVAVPPSAPASGQPPNVGDIPDLSPTARTRPSEPLSSPPPERRQSSADQPPSIAPPPLPPPIR